METEYQQLEEIIDNVAERIHYLAHYAIASLKNYLELTHLTEQSREKNNSTGFVSDLLPDHEASLYV